MNEKCGKAKALTLCFPQKGAIVKYWWVLSLFLSFPSLIQAETSSVSVLIDSEYNPFGKGKGQVPNALQFIVSTNKEISSVQAKTWLYMSMDPSTHDVPQGRCVLFLNLMDIPDMRDYLISGAEGPELWFPHLTKRDLLKLAVFWDTHDPELRQATINVESSAGQAFAEWKETKGKQVGQETIQTEKGHVLQRVSLEDVCRSYTSAELAKGH